MHYLHTFSRCQGRYGQKGHLHRAPRERGTPWEMKESYKGKKYLFILKRIKDHLKFVFSILWRLKMSSTDSNTDAKLELPKR